MKTSNSLEAGQAGPLVSVGLALLVALAVFGGCNREKTTASETENQSVADRAMSETSASEAVPRKVSPRPVMKVPTPPKRSFVEVLWPGDPLGDIASLSFHPLWRGIEKVRRIRVGTKADELTRVIDIVGREEQQRVDPNYLRNAKPDNFNSIAIPWDVEKIFVQLEYVDGAKSSVESVSLDNENRAAMVRLKPVEPAEGAEFPLVVATWNGDRLAFLPFAPNGTQRIFAALAEASLKPIDLAPYSLRSGFAPINLAKVGSWQGDGDLRLLYQLKDGSEVGPITYDMSPVAEMIRNVAAKRAKFDRRAMMQCQRMPQDPSEPSVRCFAAEESGDLRHTNQWIGVREVRVGSNPQDLSKRLPVDVKLAGVLSRKADARRPDGFVRLPDDTKTVYAQFVLYDGTELDPIRLDVAPSKQIAQQAGPAEKPTPEARPSGIERLAQEAQKKKASSQPADKTAAGFAPPWKSAQEATNYIIVGRSHERHEKGSLINVSTGEVAREVAMEDFGNLRKGAYLIEGVPGTFLDFDSSQHLWSPPLEALRLSGAGGFVDDGWVSSVLPERKPRGYNGPSTSRVIWAGYYIRDNLRETVWVKEGDIWIGDIDWVGGDIVNQRQVTQVGQFKWNTGQKSDAHLVCWSGQNLFIEAGFDPKKPLVRVNLTDGSVQELDWLMYEGKSIANKVVIDPAERVAIDFRVEGIRLIDLTSGKVLKIDWGAIARTGLSERKRPLDDREVTGLGKKDHWIDQNQYVVGFTIMPDSPQQAAVVLDLQQGKLNLTPVEAIDYKGKAGRYQTSRIDVISGEKPAIITQASWWWLGGGGDSDHRIEALVDLETGQVWPAPEKPKKKAPNVMSSSGWHHGWVDGHRFLYPVSDKGLSGNGAYLFDRLTGNSTKISPFPEFSKPAAVAQGKLIVFEHSGDVYRVNADGSELKKIASDVSVLGSFQPEPVNVTLGGKESIAAVEPLPLFRGSQQSFVSERDRLKAALKDEPPEIREFGMKAYELNAENYVFGFFFKRLETALAMVETRKRVGDIARPFVISKTKFTPDLVDQDKAKKCFHGKAMGLLRHDEDWTPQQKEEIATETAERATRAFTPNPQIEIDRINDLFMKALQAVEAAHKAASSGMPGKNHNPVSANPGAPTSQATKSQAKPINLPTQSSSSPAGESMTHHDPSHSTNETSYGLLGKSEESPATPPESATPEAHTLNTVFDNGPYSDYNAHSRRQILRRAQGKLRGAGLYRGGIDGAMGPGTQAAIIAWQQQENIPVTGLLDQQTLQSLYLLGLVEQAPPRKRIYQGEQVREYRPGPDAAEVIRRVLPWTP
jgi:Putative peptidoglycan binding domain